MRNLRLLCCSVGFAALLLCGCGKENTENQGDAAGMIDFSADINTGGENNAPSTDAPTDLETSTDSGVGENTAPPIAEDTNVSTSPPTGMFDSIDGDTPSTSDDTETGSGSVGTPIEGSTSTAPTTQLSEREQINKLADGWSKSVPAINIDLFKKSSDEFKASISTQYPLSLRYVWGQPKVKAEPIDGAYRDTWACNSSDGTFSGRIYVSYDGTDETRSNIVSASLEVVTDTNGLVKQISGNSTPSGGATQPTFESGPTLNEMKNALNDTSKTQQDLNTMLSGKSYEDLVISWGRSDHSDAEGYYWKVDTGFIRVTFDASNIATAVGFVNNT